MAGNGGEASDSSAPESPCAPCPAVTGGSAGVRPWRQQPREPGVRPPRHPPQSISPYFFISEVSRMLACHGISASPQETNAATTLAAAGWLLLSIGVTPDIQPGDPSEGARRIRELMSAARPGH